MATEKNNKLTGKDLVTVGIYTALYFVVGMGAGFLGFFPIFIPLLTVILLGLVLVSSKFCVHPTKESPHTNAKTEYFIFILFRMKV